jgi:hypothetical protein
MKRIPALLALVLLLSLAFQPSSSAQTTERRPLPPMPSQTAINNVVAQTGGAVFTPIDIPASVLADVGAIAGIFSGSILDTDRAVHYIDSMGTLRESVVPIANLHLLPLAPMQSVPGSPSRVGMIIGALHQPSRDAMWIVVTFTGILLQPDTVRFYYSPTEYYEQKAKVGTFTDPEAGARASLADAGGAMSSQRTCLTVGLQQVCWNPYSPQQLRDQDKPAEKVARAEARFRQIYKFRADIDAEQAVPDLLGKSLRENCAATLVAAASFQQIEDCRPNVFFAAAKELLPNQPIGLIVVKRAADVRTYNRKGVFVGELPAGKYLIMQTPMAIELPGMPTALYLIGLNGSRYLIPSTVLQGFGVGAQRKKHAAAIRDGMVGYRAFGW